MTMTMDPPSTNGIVKTDDEAKSQLRIDADRKADLVGLERTEIKVAAPDWARILQAALTVEIHVGRMRFEIALDLQDFGIVPGSPEEEAAWKKALKLGSAYTMPERKRTLAASLEGKQRAHLKRYASQTHFGYIVRLGAADDLKSEGWNFKEWLDGARRIRDEYLALGQSMYDEWPDLMSEMEADYRILGIGYYARLKAANKQGLGTLEEEVEAFVKRRMDAIKDKRDSVRASFYMTWDVTDIPLASAMAQDQADAQRLLLDRESIASERRVMWEIEQEKLRTAREKIRDGMDTLMADLRANTNGLVYDASVKVLEAIQRNGEVPGGSTKGLRNLIDNLRRIQMFPDDQIELAIKEIKRLLASESLNDDVVGTRNVMKEIAAHSKLVLMELDRAPERSTRDLGVPDTIAGLERVTRRRANQPVLTLEPVALSAERRASDEIAI